MIGKRHSIITFLLSYVWERTELLYAILFQAIPSMLLALVLCFDHQKSRESAPPSKGDGSASKGFKYIWYALTGYSLGLISALAAGILTRSPQPALLYLVY